MLTPLSLRRLNVLSSLPPSPPPSPPSSPSPGVSFPPFSPRVSPFRLAPRRLQAKPTCCRCECRCSGRSWPTARALKRCAPGRPVSAKQRQRRRVSHPPPPACHLIIFLRRLCRRPCARRRAAASPQDGSTTAPACRAISGESHGGAKPLARRQARATLAEGPHAQSTPPWLTYPPFPKATTTTRPSRRFTNCCATTAATTS